MPDASMMVRFLQIHDNADKNKIENPPPDAFVTIYFDTKQDREIALQEMRDAAAIGGTWTGPPCQNRELTLLDHASLAVAVRVGSSKLRAFRVAEGPNFYR
ncbi:pkaR [Symbiodinium sp. CCMP2592]|nr:pkaR [Symbiodinium sp. CCMP2592]